LEVGNRIETLVILKLGCCGFWENDPNLAKAGALQSQGTKGEAVAIYCDPLVTPDLECSGFPERVENMRKLLLFPGIHGW